MDTATTIAFVCASICAIASLILTFKFFCGEWLLFVVGKQVFTDDQNKIQEFKKTGKLMAAVTGAFALLMLTIMWYKGAEFAGNASLQAAGLMANNFAFLLFIVALVAFYIVQRMAKNKKEQLTKVDKRDTSSDSARMARRVQKARIDSFSTATLVFLIIITVVAFGMGLLFGSL